MFFFAGDGDRNDIHQLVIQPVFNVNLPQAWFVTLAPEIRLDWDEGDWFRFDKINFRQREQKLL